MRSADLSSHTEMNAMQKERVDQPTEYVIGGTTDCEHHASERSYLGHTGANAMYQCTTCNGVVVVARRSSESD